MEILNSKYNDIIERVLGIKHIYMYMFYSFFSLVCILLFVFKIEQLTYLLFSLLGFGWSIYFFKDRLNILEHILISPVISFVLFVVYIILLAFLSIKITILLGILFIIISLLFFFWRKVFEKENLKGKISRYDVLAFTLLCLAVLGKILSVRDVLVPNLHDPITHAFFAKEIISKGYIEFFYSPGLHIFSAFNTMFGGENVARQILLITNFFSAYSGILVYLYINRAFKNPFVGLVGGLLFSLGFTLAILFSSAGKNALIVCIPILFFFFFVLSLNRKRSSLKLTILSLFVLFAIFLTHYPVGVFASAFLLSVFLVDIRERKIQSIFVGLGAVLGFLWILKANYFKELEIPVSVTEQAMYVIPKLSFSDILLNLKSHVLGVLASRDLAFRGLLSILSPLALVGGVYMFLNVIFSKVRKSYIIFILWFVICVLIIWVIGLFQISSLAIVSETFSLSLFIFLYIFVAFSCGLVYRILQHIFNKDFLFYSFAVVYIISVSILSVIAYQYFIGNAKSPAVKESDTVVFDWMEENVDPESKVLVNAYRVGTIVFSSDAGGWLEVFTENEISMPFYEYGSLETHTNLDNYIKLNVNHMDCEALSYFEENGYDYYYQGSWSTFGPYVGEVQNLVESGWKVIYSSENSYLFEIPLCE